LLLPIFYLKDDAKIAFKNWGLNKEKWTIQTIDEDNLQNILLRKKTQKIIFG